MATGQHHNAKQEAIWWAREMLDRNAVVVDFETTGMGDAEIVQIGVIDAQGEILMDTLVKPIRRIPAAVTRIHGITNAMVKNAPGFTDIQQDFADLIDNRTFVAYNVSYEKGILTGECRRHELHPIEPADWACAMKTYAKYWGVWNPGRRSYKWQSLVNACKQQAIPVGNAHQALEDCQMTLALINKMAQL